jgi:hypothetical protein
MSSFQAVGITTKFIQDYIAKATRRLQTDRQLVATLDAEFEENTAVELDALETKGSICRVGKHEASPIFLELAQKDANPTVLKQVMTEDFTDYEAMKALACAVYANFIGLTQEDGNIAKVLDLKDHIQNLHEFGSPSAYGHALTGELKGVADLYVNKTPVSPDAVKDSLHELFVGLMVMNKMRKICPNIVFFYGGIRTGGPKIDPVTRKVVSWSDRDTVKIPWLIMEPIVPSVSFGTYVETCTVPQFFSTFYQFLLTTEIAADLYGWTHYDAHDGNFLIEEVSIPELGEVFSIPYPRQSGTVYVTSDARLVFIDFGQSTVNYNGKPRGMNSKSLRAYGVRTGPSPLHDVYKLLMFLAVRAQRTNPKVYYELEKAFRFFNATEDFEYCLEAQSPAAGIYYIYPATQRTLSRTIQEFIDYVSGVWNLEGVVTAKPLYNELRCTDCYTFTGVLKESGVFSAAFVTQAQTFQEFYDIATYLSKYGDNSYDILVKNFEYAEAREKFRLRCQKEKDTLEANLDITSPQVNAGNPASLATRAAEQAHKLAQIKLFVLVSTFEDLSLLLKIGSSVAIVFQDAALLEEIKGWRQQLQSAEPIVRKRISEARATYLAIYEMIESSRWRPYATAFPWYRISAGDVEGLGQRFKQDSGELFVESRLPAALIETVAAQPKRKPASKEKSVSPRRKSPAVEAVAPSSPPKVQTLFPPNSPLRINTNRGGEVTSVHLA